MSSRRYPLLYDNLFPYMLLMLQEGTQSEALVRLLKRLLPPLNNSGKPSPSQEFPIYHPLNSTSLLLHYERIHVHQFCLSEQQIRVKEICPPDYGTTLSLIHI